MVIVGFGRPVAARQVTITTAAGSNAPHPVFLVGTGVLDGPSMPPPQDSSTGFAPHPCLPLMREVAARRADGRRENCKLFSPPVFCFAKSSRLRTARSRLWLSTGQPFTTATALRLPSSEGALVRRHRRTVEDDKSLPGKRGTVRLIRRRWGSLPGGRPVAARNLYTLAPAGAVQASNRP